MNTPPATFGQAVDRSKASMPPHMSLADWSRSTPEGRLFAAAKAMNDPRLLAWLLAAPMAGAVDGPHPDAALLQVCAELEDVQRRRNGLWPWPLVSGAVAKGPNCIKDKGERVAAEAPLDDATWRMHLHIYRLPAHTLDGLRAKARCVLLSDPDMRELIDYNTPDDRRSSLWRDTVRCNLLASLLQDLNAGAVTAANCMDALAVQAEG